MIVVPTLSGIGCVYKDGLMGSVSAFHFGRDMELTSRRFGATMDRLYIFNPKLHKKIGEQSHRFGIECSEGKI
jgi:hypothetical protein